MFIPGKSVVGLDIGSSSVKAVEMTKTGQGFQVTGFGQIDLTSDDPESKIEATTELLKQGGFKTKRVATSISGKSVIIRYLDMMAMDDDDELRHAVRFEAEKFIPTSLDDCVIDCQRLGEGEGQGECKVLLVAVERGVVDEHLGLTQKAGFTPGVIDVDAFALVNAWQVFTESGVGLQAESEGALAFVDVGAKKTTVSIVRNGVSLFAREIQFGGDDFTEAISRAFNLDYNQAEALKRCPGDDVDGVKDAVFPTLDDLGNELQLSFDYFEGQNNLNIDRVMLSGGGSRPTFFRESLEKIYEKPTEIFNPFDGLSVSSDIDEELLQNCGMQLAVAVGLAARQGSF